MFYDHLLDLCAADFAYWRDKKPDYAAYLRSLEELNASRSDLFVVDIKRGSVALRAKADQSATTQHLLRTRIPAYLLLFRQVTTVLAPEIEISFGLLLDDLAQDDPRFPMLSFQKAKSQHMLLVPDLDTLLANFYESPGFIDELDYRSKRAAAIFVGSTTGVDPKTEKGVVNTRHGIDDEPSDRIRAAKYFWGQDKVTFKLPGVVQCDSLDTEEYLRSLGFCQGGSISWKQQYGYRLIISVDGNGATCSRVALALKSRSALAKYASPYVLFYTRALEPHVHYLPVVEDDDVIRYVSMLRAAVPWKRVPFDDIPKNANAFYRTYLSKCAQHRYTAVVLNELHGIFQGAPLEAVRRRVDSLDAPLDITIHVSNVGDIWCWPSCQAGTPRSGQNVEAFSIAHTIAKGNDSDLQYQGLFQDEGISAWIPSGSLCGEKGISRRLSGLRLRLAGQLASRYQLRYRATFADGTAAEWTDEGLWCASAERAALESFEIQLLQGGKAAQVARALRKLGPFRAKTRYEGDPCEHP